MVFFQILIFLMGLFAICQAIRHVIFFSNSRSSLSWTMIAFLVEQVLCSTGTLVFAANSLHSTLTGAKMELWNAIDPMLAVVLRAIMFGAMIHSTSRMSQEIKKIENERNR